MPRTLARLTGRNVPGTGRTASASRPDFGSRRTIPEEPYLYGITNSHAIYTPTVPRGITRIDLVTQEISEVIQFHDDEDFHLAANIPGTNILCGIREKDGSSFIDGYDLCMHYWCNPVERNAITICSDFNNTVSLEMAGDKLLTYCSISYPVYTRLNMPPIHTPEIPLPDGLKPESLSRYPGVIADAHMLLSGQQRRRHLLARRDRHRQRKDALLRPHQSRSLDTFPDYGTIPENPNSLQCKGGYIVSRANGGDTQFCLWDTTAGNLKEPFATYPNAVRSAAMYYSKDGQTRKLYVQFAGYREGDFIETYDFQTKEWRMFMFYVPFAEILLAR